MAWELTGEAFAKLLGCFDSDPEIAGRKFGELRQEITEKIFEHYGVRSTQDLEDLTDATFDRVARKLDEGEQVENISSYSKAVARLVLKEYWKKLRKKPASMEEISIETIAAASPEDDSLSSCLDHCLKNLPPETTSMIIDYYCKGQGESISQRRQSLADRLGIGLEALRNRTSRLRNKLEKCINDCCDRREIIF